MLCAPLPQCIEACMKRLKDLNKPAKYIGTSTQLAACSALPLDLTASLQPFLWPPRSPRFCHAATMR